MSLTKTVGLFAGTTLAITGMAFGSTEANNDTAMQEIAKLKEQITQLQQQNGDNWLTAQRSAEIKGLVQDVLADADARASLQGAGSTAGYNNAFFIASPDGNFLLNFNAGTQLRWSWNHRDTGDDASPGQKENNWGFSERFTEINLSGHIVDPSWQYKIGFGFFDDAGDYDGPQTIGTATLADAYVTKKFTNWWLRFGQFIAPFTAERSMGDYNMQFMDRSNSNYAFGLGRTQGIEFGWDADMWRIMASISDGVGPNSPTQNRGFNDRGGFASSPGSDFAITGRGEVKIAGTWDQFDKQQSWRGETLGVLLGIGGYFQSGRGGLAAPGDLGGTAGFPAWGAGGSQWGFTVDGAANFGGFNVSGALYYIVNDGFAIGGASGNPDETKGLGAMIQGGFFVTNDVEIVGRYEYGDFSNLGSDPGAGTSLGGNTIQANLQSVLSGGVNWYFAKNRAKWQTDIGYSFNSMGVFAVNGNGWQPDSTNADGSTNNGQFLFRTAITIDF